MRRLIPIAVAAGALALPAGASASVIELGANEPKVPVSCPANQCQAVGSVSGYQGSAGPVKNPFRIKRSGYIVAFSLNLGSPNASQTAFFTDSSEGPQYGDPPQVRLSIWRKGKRRKTRLNHRLLSQSRIFNVKDYFGSSPTFVLPRPLRVRKNYLVGITVPTWIPALSAANLTKSNWWRSSRSKDRKCKNVSQGAAQQRVGSQRKFGCTYFTARLQYTASYVPDPKKKTTTKKR